MTLFVAKGRTDGTTSTNIGEMQPASGAPFTTNLSQKYFPSTDLGPQKLLRFTARTSNFPRQFSLKPNPPQVNSTNRALFNDLRTDFRLFRTILILPFTSLFDCD